MQQPDLNLAAPLTAAELIDKLADWTLGSWRFRWQGLVLSVCILVLGWIAVGLQPSVYEASAKIYINASSQIKEVLGDQIAAPNADANVAYVKEALLGRENVRSIAIQAGLADVKQTGSEIEGIVERLRSSIGVIEDTDGRGRLSGGRTISDTAYTISFHYKDRKVAQQVVSLILDSFMEISQNGRRDRTYQVSAFLQEQLHSYEERLEQAEERLADFRRRNYDKLPDMQGGYFNRLQEEQTSLEDSLQRLELAKSRLTRVEMQISGEAPHIPLETDPLSPEGRLQSLERRLDELLLTYTESHPDVEATREAIETLKTRLKNESDMGRATSFGSTNPVYQSLVISRNAAQEEVTTLEREVDGHRKRLDSLQGVIDSMPKVEAELAQLNRDYLVIKAKYEDLLVGLERERLSREVSETEKIDFRVIDPPHTKPDPVAPKRSLLMVLIVLLSLGSGFVAPYALNFLKPVIGSTKQLASDFRVPIIGTIANNAPGESDKKKEAIVLASAYVLVAFAGFSIYLYEIVGPGLRSL